MRCPHLFVMWSCCVLGAAAQDGRPRGPSAAAEDYGIPEDALALHMSRLYQRSSRELRLKEGNTVRGFRAAPGRSDQRPAFRLDLSTLQDSELVLSVTLHFLLERRPPHRPWFCRRLQSPLCHPPALPVRLLLRSGSTGSLLANDTFQPHRRGPWQSRDLSAALKKALSRGQPLLELELDPGSQFTAGTPPYLLVYAEDEALGEPNSVAASLQRYDPSLDPSQSGRVRRDLIQNNELPEVSSRPQFFRKEDTLDRAWYLGLNPKLTPGKKEKKKKHQEDALKEQALHRELQFEDTTKRSQRRHDERRLQPGSAPESPLLDFDEKTMRKARRRLSGDGQHRTCSRRNLRVDFADIGWSEWVIAPKAFEAFYCAGTCGFPMAKVTRPSNHATIQSIVRAVGIVPGIPEPCCVPEQMDPLPVLFQDEAQNPVLKIYPNMSVQSCSCR